jgi:hypothetical protein
MKNLFKILFLSCGLLLVGCTGDFEEINTNPDAYSEVPYTNQLAYVIRSAMSQWGTALDEGEWVGHLSKIQYLNDYNGLTPSNNTYGNRWYSTYTGYVQLDDILSRTENKNIVNVCKTLQAWLIFCCVDAFGDMPYSQAFKGAPEDGGILQSPYDSQKDVITAVLAKLKEAADSWASGIGSDDLGAGDLLFNGNVKKWQMFCNSLRLRVAMRIVNVEPSTSQSVCTEIFGNPSSYPYIDSNANATVFHWLADASHFEPWYDNSRTRDDHCISDILIDHLKMMKDPRIAIIAKPAKKDGEYRGYENGALLDPADKNMISRIGALYRDIPAGTSPLIRACEPYYIMAEAALRGWSTPMSADEAYNKAVQLSMEESGVAEDEATAYLEGPGKFDGSFGMLYFEEWVGLFKQSLEAWSLYRRTGYPTYIHTAKAADGVSPRYPGARSPYNGIHNDIPFRFPYPQNQVNYNNANWSAQNAKLKDYVWGEQLWWDTRKDVH